MGGGKNNNGNSSLGLVPIHRLQPKLLTMPDYCYSDRLRHWVRDPFLQPLAFGFCLLQQNLPAVLSSRLATGLPGQSVIKALTHIPEGYCISFRKPVTEVLRNLKPCDSIAERTFPVFVDLLNIPDAKSG
jgi:hypothetical protein